MKNMLLNVLSITITLALTFAAWTGLSLRAEAQGIPEYCICPLTFGAVVTPNEPPTCFAGGMVFYNAASNGTCTAVGCQETKCKYAFSVQLMGDPECCFHVRCGTPSNNFTTWTGNCTTYLDTGSLHVPLACGDERIYRVFGENSTTPCEAEYCTSNPGEPLCYDCGGAANNQFWYQRVKCTDCGPQVR